MCGFSPRIRQNIKNSRKSLQHFLFIKNFEKKKNPFLALYGQIFFFCDIYTLEKLFNASELRKYQKFEFFVNVHVVLGGAFFGLKGVFSHGILKKPAKFKYSVMFATYFHLSF
jgi:hypothetical protein